MEYTNDIILKLPKEEKQSREVINNKYKGLKRIVRKIQIDGYVTVVIIVSTIVIIIDFLIIKQFIDVMNLL